NSKVLFGASRPLTFALPPPTLPGQPRMGLVGSDEDEVFGAIDRPAGFKYSVTSNILPPPVHELAAIPDAPVPPRLARYLPLPTGLSPRVATLARDLTKAARGPYAQAEALRTR